MASATFNGIPIPRVYEAAVSYTPRGDFGDTAGGKERGDIVGLPRRTWTMRTRPIPFAQAEQITNHFRAIGGRYGDFWMEEFGPGSTVRARITDIEVVRSYRLPDCREVALTVVEQ